jgi:uncharacterized membrane protein
MRHPLAILVFALTLVIAYFFVTHTGARLPLLTAVHFDAAGAANSFMARAQYLKFMSLLAVGLPLLIVTLTSAVYSHARNFKVPNRDYWMAPERATATRSFLIGHGIWFGTLLTGMLCFAHWMVIIANRQEPPSLSNGLAIGGLLVFVAVTLAWALVLVVAFRRPR